MFASAPGFGRQPPEELLPSALNYPVNVASRGPYFTE
jgi:hypothetical protein